MKFTRTVSVLDVTARDAGNKDGRWIATVATAVNGQNIVPMLRYLFHMS